MSDTLPPLPPSRYWSDDAVYTADQMRTYAAAAVAAERERLRHPTDEAEREGMRALRNTYRTVSGAYSREQARACWDAMLAAAIRRSDDA